jgi:hypothetical protein
MRESEEVQIANSGLLLRSVTIRISLRATQMAYPCCMYRVVMPQREVRRISRSTNESLVG